MKKDVSGIVIKIEIKKVIFVENSEIGADSELLSTNTREPVGLIFNPKASGTRYITFAAVIPLVLQLRHLCWSFATYTAVMPLVLQTIIDTLPSVATIGSLL